MEYNSGQQHSSGVAAWQSQPEASLSTDPVLTADMGSGRSKHSLNYSRVSSLFFGLVQILLALLSVTGGVFAIIFEAPGSWWGTGFWCGLMYVVAGCLATAASGCPTNPLVKSVAVFSMLCIVFGITATVLGILGCTEMATCDDESCRTLNGVAFAGNAMVGTTGFYAVLFGLCMFVVSIRAICKTSTVQVAAFTQVYYSTNSPESIQINNATGNQQIDSNVYTQNQQQQQQQQQQQHWTTHAVVYAPEEGKPRF